jgi:hypothetical protein
MIDPRKSQILVRLGAHGVEEPPFGRRDSHASLNELVEKRMEIGVIHWRDGRGLIDAI